MILVTGGAGYIGSHTVAQLIERKLQVGVLDNLSLGHAESVPEGVPLFNGDLRDIDFVRNVFAKNKIDAVVHFAAFSQVGESMQDPLKYYNNNFIGSLTLLNVMKEAGVNKIVFSSTAATYGEPENIPILETDRTLPTNPYGETKLAFEKVLKWADAINGIKHIVLRYFNACGAHPTRDIGEDHKPETHLIPIVLQAALGQREFVSVFGDDYKTSDGTCVRDYIHVTDLSEAHVCALDRLNAGKSSSIYNLGNGTGFSVKQIIDTARKVTGKEIPVKMAARRAGDPATLIATSSKAQTELGWKPKYNTPEIIIETAWKWHKGHPNGYGK